LVSTADIGKLYRGAPVQSGAMELLPALWDLAVHLDRHLAEFVAAHGAWVYALLFVIVFIETGLVIWPFLPGDSLLFVTGAIAAAGGMDIFLVMGVLIAAALTGDNVNYFIGRWAGPRVFHYERSRWFNPAHLARTHAFYERHGGKTIILARFIPIVRTYVPFVAGIGSMPYGRYIGFCIAGAVLWVVSLCGVGYFFGNIPAVKNNLTVVILLIVLLSISPGLYAWAKHQLAQRQG
jgi:membrane-associated protein